MNSSIRREGERVWLEDVPRPQHSCSSLSVLAAALRHRGEEVSYTWLMGVSGGAFRLQFSWCPSAPHACVGFHLVNPALEAVGYSERVLAGTHVFGREGSTPATDADREQTRQAVRDEIDAGRCVTFGSEEAGLLVGYEPISDANPTGWLRRPGPVGGCPRPDEPYLLPIRQMPWGLSLLRRMGPPLPRREAGQRGLRAAVENADRGAVPAFNGELKIGFAAWEKWIGELEPEPFAAMVAQTQQQLNDRGRGKEDALWSLALGNAWTYENLYFARYEAAAFLRQVGPDLPETARPHALRAADAYEKAQKALVPEGECFTTIAPFPFMVKDLKREWTDDRRQRQATLLLGALKHERVAIDALKAALAAEGW